MRAAVLTILLSTTGALAQTGLPAPVSDADYRPVDIARAEVGQLLFWHSLLSGNKTISCATCHHPPFGTSDGQSLGMGEGGLGLGPERRADANNLPEQRIPRNSPAIWNLGAAEFTRTRGMKNRMVNT